MKNFLSAVAAAVMLFSCSACGNNQSAPAETSETASSAALSSFEEQTSETTVISAEQTTTAKTDSLNEDTTVQSTERSSGSISEMGELTKALYDRIKNHKGQVEMKMSQIAEEQPGMKVDIDVIVADQKLRFVMECGNLFSLTMVGDGKVNYLLDDEHKLYCKMDQDGVENPMSAENTPLLNENGLGKYLGTGQSSFKGTQRTYEEYLAKSDDEEKEDLNTRYYYDDKGDLIGFSTKKDGKEEVMDFSIKFSDQVKENLFVLPSDYKEGSAEEVIASVYGKMLEALLGGLEDLDLGALVTSSANS